MIIYNLIILILYNLTFPSNADVCIGLCHCKRDIVDCSSLDLTEIPADVPNNTRVLIFSDNDIETIDASHLQNFRFLDNLDLSNNIITNLDANFFKNVPNLQVLNLRKNRLSRIPQGIQYLKNLDKLVIRSNLISLVGVDEFSHLGAVRHVDLSRNSISFLPKPVPFKTPTIIERLDLASNAIIDISHDLFSAFSSLVSLRLSKNHLTSLTKYSFSRLPRLETIDLSRNLIREVRNFAFNQLPSLKNVTMAKNDIYRLDDGMFYACENLARLNLSTNRVQSVTEGWMFGLTSLEILDLSFNQIQSFHTSSWLHTPNLKWLSLHSNRIQSLPSGSFRALRKLQELILSANSIDSLHKFALVGMNNLHSLDLSSNTLAVCVEDGAVLYNTSMPFLRSLRFTNNQLRVIPSMAFERFPALEELDITDNPIATIHPNAFEPLKLKRLAMNSSSILCDCQISWFSPWVFKLQLDRSKIIAKCAYPQPFQNLDVIAIDRANLTCLDDSPRAKLVGQPDEVKSLVGGNARFTCNAYGEGPLMIEWRVMSNGQARVLVQDPATFMNVNKTTIINGTLDERELAVAELILFDVAMTDSSDYQCVARNRFGSDFSRHVSLMVHQAPTFTQIPTDMSLLVGQNAKFVCSATGTPRPELKWAFDGGLFPAAEGRRLYVKPNDDHIYIMNVSISDQGGYTCHASNIAGQVQAGARLKVYENVFRTQLESRTVREGDDIGFDCFSDLDQSTQKMTWTKEGLPIQHSKRTQFSSNNQILILTNTKFSDTGEYSCQLWADGMELARQTINIMIVSEEEYPSSPIYLKASQFRAMASKWVERVNNDTNRKWFIGTMITTTLIFFGICTSFLCCLIKCISEKRRANKPVYV